jgi:hypothetical protein
MVYMDEMMQQRLIDQQSSIEQMIKNPAYKNIIAPSHHHFIAAASEYA